MGFFRQFHGRQTIQGCTSLETERENLTVSVGINHNDGLVAILQPGLTSIPSLLCDQETIGAQSLDEVCVADIDNWTLYISISTISTTQRREPSIKYLTR